MTRLELLDSARHKPRLAGYHAAAVLRVLEQHPTEDLDDPRRIEMEAHLEGLAYTGTAAAEKTLRSIDPEAMIDQMPIQQMLRTVKANGRPDERRDFGRAFERWWVRGRSGRLVRARTPQRRRAPRLREGAGRATLAGGDRRPHTLP